MWISMQQVLTEYYLLHQSSALIFVSYIWQALSWECLSVSSCCTEKACLIGCCSSWAPVFCSFSAFSLVLKQESVHVCLGTLIWCRMSLNLTATTEQILKGWNGAFDRANRKAKENKPKKLKTENVTFEWVMLSVYSNSTWSAPVRLSAVLLKTSGEELPTGVEVSLTSLIFCILLLLLGVLSKELADNWWSIAQSGKALPCSVFWQRSSGVFFPTGVFLSSLFLVFFEPPERQFAARHL